jgi:hypothetical protein
VAPPTIRQVYALAAALCERMGEEFPESREAASETIERLRTENGHPQPRLEDVPLPKQRSRRHERGANRLASIIARKLADELRNEVEQSSSGSGRHRGRRAEPDSALVGAAPEAEPR